MIAFLLGRSDDLGIIPDWPRRRAEAEETTRRMLGGWAGNRRVIGSRSHDATIADRERRARGLVRVEPLRMVRK